eukprot:CAMPEP_0185025374 /NCGR_PEP_ID=MMETSP1103-20130426/8359_1 /TAXON_ID=36769 /ORGANISM="Paraphysomonas bandaiensis, Strain Caron Lab Isolate" /LENGTH=206 /DNA_ID=CAMNT_0027558565 /DNA_START=327 /DNA_END=948 /DNA_ORIENTATION=+
MSLTLSDEDGVWYSACAAANADAAEEELFSDRILPVPPCPTSDVNIERERTRLDWPSCADEDGRVGGAEDTAVESGPPICENNAWWLDEGVLATTSSRNWVWIGVLTQTHSDIAGRIDITSMVSHGLTGEYPYYMCLLGMWFPEVDVSTAVWLTVWSGNWPPPDDGAHSQSSLAAEIHSLPVLLLPSSYHRFFYDWTQPLVPGYSH